MADPASKIYEGVFAVHKPRDITSAQVIRDLQAVFQSSSLFQPWIDREKARQDAESPNQKQKRRSWKSRQRLQVKMGHGGTLDPMATGVLILGVGSGTKELGNFLECTKSYETVVLFGAASDSYDSVGKLVARKPYGHITRDAVEAALEKFRGNIMQRPPIFSALKVQGKKMYEYAREGKELPIEIQERPVTVESLEMVEWMEGGAHEWHWPTEEAEQIKEDVVETVLHLGHREGAGVGSEHISSSTKRKRDDDGKNTALEGDPDASPKRLKFSPSPTQAEDAKVSSAEAKGVMTDQSTAESGSEARSKCPAPACRLRMTVTSGFYVRSLCHDLGAAVGSLGLMSSLVRTRQGDFEIDKNVLEYSQLEQGQEVWEPVVGGMLETWQAQAQDKPTTNKQKAAPKSDRRSSPTKKERPKETRPSTTSERRRRNSSSELE